MNQQPRQSKLAFTVVEVSFLLGLSRAMVYRLLDLGELKSITIGRSRRITGAQLHSFLERREADAGRPSGTSWFDSTTMTIPPSRRK